MIVKWAETGNFKISFAILPNKSNFIFLFSKVRFSNNPFFIKLENKLEHVWTSEFLFSAAIAFWLTSSGDNFPSATNNIFKKLRNEVARLTRESKPVSDQSSRTWASQKA